MVFGHHGRPLKLDISIGNVPIKQASSFKYLGIVLSPLLGWDAHISHVSSKVKWRIAALRGVASRRILSSNLALLFHRCYVLSVLSYAAPAWLCMSNSSYTRLFELQAASLRAALDLPFDADSFGCVIVANHTPIDVLFSQLLADYGQRTFLSNPAMAKFIKHHLKMKLPADEEQTARLRSPAWQLESLRNVRPSTPPTKTSILQLYLMQN